jgi:translation initiation factor IF-3
LNLRINKQIRALKVRLIDADGSQVGVCPIKDALIRAQEANLDLVEIAPNAQPPVCKIIDYGKFRYDQTKREKESKKSQHQVKVKEIKLKPNIDEHDFLTKCKQARQFIEKGNKVKVTCVFRGREMAHPELGQKVVERFCKGLEDISLVEAPPKLLGRSLIGVLAPAPVRSGQKAKPPIVKKEQEKEKVNAKNENA